MALTKIDDRGVKYPLDLLDNEKIRFGTGNDLEIFHDGSHSRIKDTGTGGLYTSASIFKITNAAVTENMFLATEDSAVELYYDSSKKFETTSAGATLTGDLTVAEDAYGRVEIIPTAGNGGTAVIKQTTTSPRNGGDLAIQVDSSVQGGNLLLRTGGSTDRLKITSSGDVQIPNDSGKLQLGTSQDLAIYHNGTSSLIDNNTGHLYIRNNVDDDDGSNVYIEAKAGEQSAIFTHDAGVELRYDNAKKFETNAGGILVTGNITTGDNNEVACGANGDLKLYHNGTNSYIDNHQGDLYIRGEDDHIVLQPVDGESAIVCDPNGSVNLYYDNFKTLHTKSNGIVLTGPESTDCNIDMYADDGDDNADFWRIVAGADGGWRLYNYASGSYEKSISCAGDGNVELYHNNVKTFETTQYGATCKLADTSAPTLFMVIGSEGQDAEIRLLADDGDDGPDYWRLLADASDPDFYLQNYHSGAWETNIKATGSGSVELYNDNTKRLETNSYGSRVTGYQTQSAFPIASLSHSGAVDVSNAELTSSNCYDQVWVNQGSHFNASTGRFTCPVAGVYRIFFGASIDSDPTNVRLKKNGSTIAEAYSDDLNALYNVSQEIIIDAAANDYLHIQVSGLKTMSGTQHKQFTFQLIS